MKNEPLRIKIEDIPEGKTFDDYPEDTIFVLDDKEPAEDEAYWDD